MTSDRESPSPACRGDSGNLSAGEVTTAPTDPQLVGACATGNQEAWHRLVERYSPLVHSIAVRSGLGADLCDDVHQNTFLALHRNIGGLRDAQSLAKWIITTATRESWRIKRTSGTPLSPTDTWAIDPDAVESLERSHAVDQALGKLGGRCEELLRALFGRAGELDYQSISTAFGMPLGSIGPTRRRCLAKLADILGNFAGENPAKTGKI